MFRTLQGRLPVELEERGIVEMRETNKYLLESFVDDFNRRFAVTAKEEGSGFVPLLGVGLEDILCLKHQRVVGNDNCVKYGDGSMAVVHEGKRKLGVYDREGNLLEETERRRKVASG